MTERRHFHFSLPCIGEGNGNPLQCSCLENPRDGGAWWAAVYGVAQSRTRLNRLSSSSSMKTTPLCLKASPRPLLQTASLPFTFSDRSLPVYSPMPPHCHQLHFLCLKWSFTTLFIPVLPSLPLLSSFASFTLHILKPSRW